MDNWEMRYPIDCSARGDNVHIFAHKTRAEFARIYRLLNKLRQHLNLPGDSAEKLPCILKPDDPHLHKPHCGGCGVHDKPLTKEEFYQFMQEFKSGDATNHETITAISDEELNSIFDGTFTGEGEN